MPLWPVFAIGIGFVALWGIATRQEKKPPTELEKAIASLRATVQHLRDEAADLETELEETWTDSTWHEAEGLKYDAHGLEEAIEHRDIQGVRDHLNDVELDAVLAAWS